MPAASNPNQGGHDLKALSVRWFEEVWNQGREATIDELLAPDAAIHGLDEAGRGASGAAGFRAFYHLFRRALPDLRVTVEDVLCDGDRTAVRVTGRATHTGEGLGVPPTGRPVVLTGIILTRWRDGRIAEGWNEFDAAGLMRQIAGPTMVSVKAG